MSTAMVILHGINDLFILLRAHNVSSMNLHKAVSFERPFINLNCLSMRILSVFKNSFPLWYITFSNILENAVSNEVGL